MLFLSVVLHRCRVAHPVPQKACKERELQYHRIVHTKLFVPAPGSQSCYSSSSHGPACSIQKTLVCAPGLTGAKS